MQRGFPLFKSLPLLKKLTNTALAVKVEKYYNQKTTLGKA
jgi:hypothetical protein